jgi:hypothetical protein
MGGVPFFESLEKFAGLYFGFFLKKKDNSWMTAVMQVYLDGRIHDVVQLEQRNNMKQKLIEDIINSNSSLFMIIYQIKKTSRNFIAL